MWLGVGGVSEPLPPYLQFKKMGENCKKQKCKKSARKCKKASKNVGWELMQKYHPFQAERKGHAQKHAEANIRTFGSFTYWCCSNEDFFAAKFELDKFGQRLSNKLFALEISHQKIYEKIQHHFSVKPCLLLKNKQFCPLFSCWDKFDFDVVFRCPLTRF